MTASSHVARAGASWTANARLQQARDVSGEDAGAMATAEIELSAGDGPSLPGLWTPSDGDGCVLVVAHGAGSGMRAPFLDGFAAELAALGHPVLRFEFP